MDNSFRVGGGGGRGLLYAALNYTHTRRRLLAYTREAPKVDGLAFGGAWLIRVVLAAAAKATFVSAGLTPNNHHSHRRRRIC